MSTLVTTAVCWCISTLCILCAARCRTVQSESREHAGRVAVSLCANQHKARALGGRFPLPMSCTAVQCVLLSYLALLVRVLLRRLPVLPSPSSRAAAAGGATVVSQSQSPAGVLQQRSSSPAAPCRPQHNGSSPAGQCSPPGHPLAAPAPAL
jgi:hypothetical protein